jgi:DNA helicase-2/ATP-dependent DNA helicase PcrA
MDVSPLLESLNPAQREAVAAAPGHILVLAGAGSGKTRVLTHRIAWLVRAEGTSPYGLLAVTFTNKAANEMRVRIAQLVGASVGGMWIGTFHGLAHRLLRFHWREAGLPQDFQILDSEDQLQTLRRVLKSLELDEQQWQPKQIQWFINARKDEGLRARHLRDQGDLFLHQMIRLYEAYESACQRSGLVDFGELLLRSYELWRDSPSLLAHYRERFRHILVDEFQDTNALQYEWLRLLAGDTGHVFAVGDDDQSIYSWRGARVENMLRFSHDFPDAQVLRLEQNYRSTAIILKGANALIAHNTGRLGKNLWTQGESGEPILLYTAYSERDEARFVVERIESWVACGQRRSDAAILYRSNVQSRVFEEELFTRGIPYRVYGGLRFFERAEIKDALAYLRLLANCADDASFERVVNHPARGIGDRSLELVRRYAREHEMSLWQAAAAVTHQDAQLAPRSRGALASFLQLIETVSRETQGLTLSLLVQQVLERSSLIAHYAKERSDKGEMRVENLKELVTAARQFEGVATEGIDPLSAFLAHAALEAGETQGEPFEDSVQLMTLHSAKGLEFPLVFMCGMEEGLFPHRQSLAEDNRLEEERRLCYVGMTRARRQLYLTCAETRRLYGTELFQRPSRFLREIPPEVAQDVRLGTTRGGKGYEPLADLHARAPGQVGPAADGLKPGQRVRHAKFGTGVVLSREGEGTRARVEVNFQTGGRKWLVVAYANLQTL